MKERLNIELRLAWKNLPLFLFLGFMLCWFLSIFTRALALYFHVPTKERLWDLGFKLFPVSDKLFLNDFFQWFLWGSLGLTLALPVLSKKFHKKGVYGFVTFIEVVTCLTIVHSIRAVTYHLTRLPSPSWRCMSDPTLRVPKSMHGTG